MEPLVAPQRIPPRPPAPPAPPTTDEGDKSGGMPAGNNSLRRTTAVVPLAEQDRSQWDTELIAEGVAVVQATLAKDQLGEYQAQAAIAALHADAPRFEDTDWIQILEWYDELLRFADTPIIRLNRAVALGEADGAPAGLAALADIDENIPRRDAVAAHLHERNGDLELAARLYAAAARNAPNLAERDHQTRQAARLNQHLRHQR
jgi:predicted RNA polymerase sigma factor